MTLMLNSPDKQLNTSAPGRGNKSCALGGCGTTGLCPGTALALSAVAGVVVTDVTGMTFLGWVLGIGLFVFLLGGLRARIGRH